MFFILAGSSSAACADSDVEVIEVEEFDFEIGLLDGEEFDSLASPDTVEIVVGFQGLIFIDLSLAAEVVLPERVSVVGEVNFTNEPSLTFNLRTDVVLFEQDGDGSSIAPDFRVLFGFDLELLDGKEIELELKLEARGWLGTAQAQFFIVDQEQCFEDPNGELDCTESD
jgi:hypothetical protein